MTKSEIEAQIKATEEKLAELRKELEKPEPKKRWLPNEPYYCLSVYGNVSGPRRVYDPDIIYFVNHFKTHEAAERRSKQIRAGNILFAVAEELNGDWVYKCGNYAVLYYHQTSHHFGLNIYAVFSYNYYYGSCSACDDWEARSLSEQEIASEMKKEATFFDSLEQYNSWAEKQ